MWHCHQCLSVDHIPVGDDWWVGEASGSDGPTLLSPNAKVTSCLLSVPPFLPGLQVSAELSSTECCLLVFMLTFNAAAPAEVPEVPFINNTLHGPHQHLWGCSEIGFLLKSCKLCTRDNLRSQCHILFSGNVGLHTGTFWCQISHLWVWCEVKKSWHAKVNVGGRLTPSLWWADWVFSSACDGYLSQNSLSKGSSVSKVGEISKRTALSSARTQRFS